MLYGTPEDPPAFDAHHAATHVPLTEKETAAGDLANLASGGVTLLVAQA